MSIAKEISIEFKRRVLDESFSRISQCVDLLNDDELWLRPNSQLVTIANLILHLNGNVRQWILSGIANREDRRARDNEFNQTERIDRKVLLDSLSTTVLEAINTVDNLTDAQLYQNRNVQGFDETILSIIIHVIEHFSYHTGQITFYTKYLKEVDTKYYGGQNLNKVST